MNTSYGIPKRRPYSDDELWADEQQLESLAMNEGVSKYFDKLEKAEDRTVFLPELKRLKKEIPLLSKAILKGLVKPGPMAKIKKSMLKGIHPDEIALLVIRHCFNHYLGDQTIQKLARTLMNDIRIHKDDKRFADEFPAYRAVVMQNIQSDHAGHRHKVLTHARHKMGIEDTHWSDNHKVVVGSWLIDTYCGTCGAFYKDDFIKPTKRYSKDKKRMVRNTGVTIKPTQETVDWLEENHEFCSKLAPVLKPMVVEPKPWGDPYYGGYISISRTHNSSCRFIRRVRKRWLLDNRENIDGAVYEAVNSIQKTPYRINVPVLEVMLELKRQGNEVAGLPDQEKPELRLPPTPWDGDDEHKAFKKKHPEKYNKIMAQRSEIFKRYYRELSQRTALNEKLRFARMYAKYERFWFPMNLDWRGRLFCMSSPFLTPQGDDPSKGLLEYADGKEISAEGFIEFCIHGANVFGKDKLSEMDRCQWVNDNQSYILAVAENPYGEAQLEWWSTCDKPFQFLAWCFEYAEYMKDRSFKSRLICHIDQTCSGLQHWSAVLQDGEGGSQVGMVNKDMPDDIYQAVADEVERLIANDPDPIAIAWRGKVTRIITKRNVMTKLYGATMPGMRDQVKHELERLDKKQPGRYLEDCPVDNYKASEFISRKNDEAMRLIIQKATEGMDFTQLCAKTLAKAGLPVRWTSPIGLPIEQTYWKTHTKRVETYWMSVKVPKGNVRQVRRGGGQRIRLNLSYHDPDKGIQEKKAENSIAPNYIHSMDASHLMFVALGWKDEGERCFTPVHDSFGTHASDLPDLHKVVREQFVMMYEDRDHLYEFLRGISLYHPDITEIARPMPGNINIREVLDATYFCR